MAGVTISFGVDDSVMRKRIAGVRKRLKDLSPVMEGRAKAFNIMTKRDVFNAEASPLGKPWKPIKAATAKRKGSTKILTDDGFLQNAIVATATAKSVRGRVSGNPAAYARKHQFGGEYNRMSTRGKPYKEKVDARPFLPLTESGQAVATSGPMKTWMDRLRKRVLAFVLTGQL